MVRLSLNAPMQVADVTPDLRVPGKPLAPKFAYAALFDSPRLEVGLWEGGPGFAAFNDHPTDEVDYVIRGKAVIRDGKTGRTQTVSAGEHFAIPKGFTGTMQMASRTKLLFTVARVEQAK